MPQSSPAVATGRPSTHGAPVLLGVLAALIVSLAACGDDSSETAEPGGSTPPSVTTSTKTGGTAIEPIAGGGTGSNPSACVEDWGGEALFADQFTIRHAENYSISYEDNYKVVEVAEPYPGAKPATYVLVQCGTDAPELTGKLDGAQVIDIPVTSLYSASTSHLGFIDELGIADVVTGVSNAEFVKMPSVIQRIEAGDVEAFAPDYEVDAELVIANDPDVLVTGGTEDPTYEAIVEAGVPVMANAEWLETSPKGWAEWVGFFAALTNTEATANELYGSWADDYDDAAALVADVDERPSVITGSLYQGTWMARGGAGIVPRFIADAGGDYLYADDGSTGSLELDIEQVLADAGNVDVWLSPLGEFTSERAAIGEDERYRELAAWDRGGVWTNRAAVDPDVSLAEVGPTMIGAYLRDYIKILHPEVLTDHEFAFFTEIPSS